MSYNPISGFALQVIKDNGSVAADYYLKFYEANSTTPLSMATDASGAVLLAKAKINDQGMPISNPLDNTTVFIPYLNKNYRLVVYTSEADADANNTAAAFVNIASVELSASAGDITANGGYLEYGGTANTITLTNDSGSPSAYSVGQLFRFRATATNTGAVTINVNGAGAKSAVTIDGSALPASYLATDKDTTVTYDGTNFVVYPSVQNDSSDLSGGKVVLTDGFKNRSFVSYNTIAAAKADDDLAIGDRVKTAGYHTAGDGGGAEYIVVTGGTGTDDGGSYHDMANGLQLQLVVDGPINAKVFGARGDDSNDDTNSCVSALSFVKSNKLDLVFTEGTYKLDQLILDGSGYRVINQGRVTIRQNTGTSETTGQIFIVTGQDIEIGDFHFIGNIATDTLEFHHCIYVYDDNQTAEIRNIRIGNIYGTDIRGDVVYCGGTDASPLYGLTLKSVSGSNVLRNLFTCAGGSGVHVGSVVNDGPVGYRDFDVEPNIGSSQSPDVRIDYVYGGAIQTTSDEPTRPVNRLSIGYADLDLNRVQATTPPYSLAPGVNANAITSALTRQIDVEYLKARNYNSWVWGIGQSTIKTNIRVGVLDFENCDITDAVYNSIFADLGTGGADVIEIDRVNGTLYDNTKFLANGNGCRVIVNSGVISGGKLLNSCPDSHIKNLDIDCGNSIGFFMASCDRTILENVRATNAASTTLLYNSSNVSFKNCSGTFGSLFTVNSDDISLDNTVLNGVHYRADYGAANLPNRSGTVNLGGGTSVNVTFGTPEGNNAYFVQITPTDSKNYFITNKLTTGFTVNCSVASAGSVDWLLHR